MVNEKILMCGGGSYFRVKARAPVQPSWSHMEGRLRMRSNKRRHDLGSVPFRFSEYIVDKRPVGELLPTTLRMRTLASIRGLAGLAGGQHIAATLPRVHPLCAHDRGFQTAAEKGILLMFRGWSHFIGG